VPDGSIDCVVGQDVAVGMICAGTWKDGTAWETFFQRHQLDMSAGWAPEQLAPFLHDGTLTIRLTVDRLLP
jgi:hypothetical protein